MSTSFPILPLLGLLQRWCRHPFLLLLQAAQRVRVAWFPLPLLPPPLSILLANALLLFQATDALLLGWAYQLPQLDSLDVVKGRLAGFVQHNGVKDDVEQRNTWDLLKACGYCVVLCGNKVVMWVCLLQHGQKTLGCRNWILEMWTFPDLKPLQDDFSSIQLFPQSLQFFQCTVCGAQLNFPHQILGHLLFDLNLVFQRSLTKSPINENLKRFPEAEVVFVETDCFLCLFLSLDLHGIWWIKSVHRLNVS